MVASSHVCACPYLPASGCGCPHVVRACTGQLGKEVAGFA